MATNDAPVKVNRVPMIPQRFKEEMYSLKKDEANLTTLALKVGSEGSVSVMLPGRTEVETFGPQQIRSFRALINKKIESLASEYSLLYRQKKAKKNKGRAGGLPNLSLITDTYRRFWQGANLGTIDPNDPNSGIVTDNLPLLTEQGITSSALLQSAWADYIDVNNLRVPGHPTLHTVANDKYLQAALGPALDWLEANTPTEAQWEKYNDKVAEAREAGTKISKIAQPEKFDRNSFSRSWLASIGSLYTVPRPTAKPTPAQIYVRNDQPMTVEQEAILRQDDNRQEVQTETNLLKQLRDSWNQKLQTGIYAPKKGTRRTQYQQDLDADEEAADEVADDDVVDAM